MITVFPYAKVNGNWSVPDSYIKSIFQKTLQDGSVRKLFWDGRVQTEDQFLEYFQDPKNLPILIFKDQKLEAYFWLNSIGRNFAFVHYCFFSNSWGGDKKDMFESAISYWFNFMYGEKPLFDVLVGMVPSFNKHAINLIKEFGFTKIGEIPNMIDDIYLGKKFPVTIAYRGR